MRIELQFMKDSNTAKPAPDGPRLIDPFGWAVSPGLGWNSAVHGQLLKLSTGCNSTEVTGRRPWLASVDVATVVRLQDISPQNKLLSSICLLKPRLPCSERQKQIEQASLRNDQILLREKPKRTGSFIAGYLYLNFLWTLVRSSCMWMGQSGVQVIKVW